ncbi:MAG: hydrogenase [Verrucomicrobia bacterium]|nr:MAG: hydrogenase [Verrucomicrobiota bacterium]
MFDILRKSLSTGIVTVPFPPPASSPGLRGAPEINFEEWKDARPATAICPTGAIAAEDRNGTRSVTLDLGKCIFCGLCAEADPAIRMTHKTELAMRKRADLCTTAKYALNSQGAQERLLELAGQEYIQGAPSSRSAGRRCSSTPDPRPSSFDSLGSDLQDRIRKTFGRSLHIREVDAGSCNGCEVEIVGLNSPIYDIERFGIHFVASPRHADMLLVTGPVSRNMELALRKTYDAIPEPRLVVAVGACGCSGGIFGQNYASLGGVDRVLPVDVYVPGCPPTPLALLQGILLAIGKGCQMPKNQVNR